MSSKKDRLNRELTQIKKSPPAGVLLWTKDDNVNTLEATITGPENSPYENGVFKLEIQIPENYPFSPPAVKFITSVYHPNIDNNGRICLNLIKMPPNGDWKPTLRLEGILIAVRMLLECPNPNDPLMHNIAHEYLTNKEVFLKKAQTYTEKYAVPKTDQTE